MRTQCQQIQILRRRNHRQLKLPDLTVIQMTVMIIMTKLSVRQIQEILTRALLKPKLRRSVALLQANEYPSLSLADQL